MALSRFPFRQAVLHRWGVETPAREACNPSVHATITFAHACNLHGHREAVATHGSMQLMCLRIGGSTTMAWPLGTYRPALLHVHWLHRTRQFVKTMRRWVAFSLSPYTRKPLQRLLGCIGWLGAGVAGLPSRQGACLRGHAHGFAWEPPSAHCVPFAVCRGLLEAAASRGQGWEPEPTESPAIRVYTDVAECPCAPGGFFVGVWTSEGPVIRRT